MISVHVPRRLTLKKIYNLPTHCTHLFRMSLTMNTN